LGKPVGQRFIVTSKNKGFSLIEVVVVVAVMALAITSFSLLFLGVNLTKSANKNLLTASTLAEDILEHIRKTSINGFSDLTDLIGSENSLEVDFNSADFALLYKDDATALDTLPEAKDLSSVTFEVKERNLINNAIEKLMVTVVIRWKEIARNPGEQIREYRLTTYITKSGLREFIE